MGHLIGGLVVFFLFGLFQSVKCRWIIGGVAVLHLLLGWLQAMEETEAKKVRASATRAEARARRAGVDEDAIEDARDAAEVEAARHDGWARVYNRAQIGVWAVAFLWAFGTVYGSCPGARIRDAGFSELDRLGTGPHREELIVIFPACEAGGASQQAFIDLRLPGDWEVEVFPAGGTAEDPTLRSAGARAIASRRCPDGTTGPAVARFGIAGPHRVWSEGDRPPDDSRGERGLRWEWKGE